MPRQVKANKYVMWRYLCLALLICSSRYNASAYAAQVEDWLATGIDANGYHIMLYNPAITYDNSQFLSVIALRGSRNESVIGSPHGNLQNINYKTKLEGLGGGFLIPLGGASFGLHYAESREELSARNDAVNRIFMEKQAAKDWAFRFIIELSPTLRAAFLYQIRKIENDIYGSFSLSEQDRTIYKAQLSGYRLGLFYDIKKFSLGLYTAPPLRGKGTVAGEEKIMTEAGSAGADVGFEGQNKLNFGFGFTQWYYKRDDRYPLSSSPLDQRSISLNGLALRQYMRKTNEYRIGASFEVRNNTGIALNYGRGRAVFLFDDDAVPGDRRNRETEVKLSQYILSLRFNKNNFAMDFSYYIEAVSKGEIIDPTGKLGHRQYQAYRSNQNATVLSFSLNN